MIRTYRYINNQEVLLSFEYYNSSEDRGEGRIP